MNDPPFVLRIVVLRAVVLSVALLTLGGKFCAAQTEWIETMGMNSSDYVGTGPWSPDGLRIGDGSSVTGSLLVEGGGQVFNIGTSGNTGFGILGSGSNSLGTATITGNGSLWSNAQTFRVGDRGAGILNVLDGAQVISGVDPGYESEIGYWNSGSGTVNVSGAGSHYQSGGQLHVGFFGTGEMNIEAGGKVTSRFGTIGTIAGGSGIVTVQGEDAQGTASLWDVTRADGVGLSLRVGHQGDAVLNILDGGQVRTSNFNQIGEREGTTGVVTVSGVSASGNRSSWTNGGGGRINIGKFGTGELNVLNGGLVTTGGTVLGGRLFDGTTGTGTLNVEGTNSVFQVLGGSLEVGSGSEGGGNGTLNVLDGGVVNDLDGFVGRTSRSVATATISGTNSHWNNSDELYIGGSGFGVGGTGTLIISDNAQVTVGRIMRVWDEGTVNFSSGKLDVGQLNLTAPTATDDFHMTGGKLVVELVSGNLHQEGGVLAPGDTSSFATIEMLDDYTMLADASIEFELGGLDRGTEYDAIDIDGLAMLNGEMNINLVGQLIPSQGDTFRLINATNIAGSLDFDFSNAVLRQGLAWDTGDFQSSGTISVTGVPEPSSGLLLLGLAGTLSMMRRKKVPQFG